ncbi:MAG TPA: (d)CMP kinase [Candidatus Saccharimonadia bacterium]
MTKLIIAIDGGAGTGTSTVARGVAERLKLPHLNTGELYRGITFLVLQNGINPIDSAEILKLAKTIDFGFDDSNVVTVNGYDVRGKLHQEDINEQVAVVSSHEPVRDEILHLQRNFANEHGVVMEGRDITTRIFPETPYKFYFTCDPEERVRRVNAGGRAHETVASLLKRDAADAAKVVGTFKQADDATVIDTTNRTIDEVVSFIVELVKPN